MFQAELGAAEVYPNFQKKSVLAMPKKTSTVAKYRFQNESALVINYDKPLIHFGTDILKIVAVLVSLDTSYFC